MIIVYLNNKKLNKSRTDVGEKMIEMKSNGSSKYLIDEILYWVEGHQEKIKVNYNADDNKSKMYYVSEYHGDHSENWVIYEKNGQEVGRTNAKECIHIKWSERLNN